MRAEAGGIAALYVFGDSLSDEGRIGRTAPVMWPEVLRADLQVRAGEDFAIGGAFTSHQPSAAFGDASYLGQVRQFVASGVPIPPGSEAAIWIGTNNVWIGSFKHQAAESIAASASADVASGIGQLVGAGVRQFVLLGVYDLSLTNAFRFAGADTAAVRSTAATASRMFNQRLASLRVPGATITYFDMAAFISHLQRNPGSYGFRQVLPLAPGALCDAACEETSIFSDTIHFSSKTQKLIGDYLAGGRPAYNGTFADYGAMAQAKRKGGAAPHEGAQAR